MTSTTPSSVRPPALAGTLYPAEAGALTNMVDSCLAQARDNHLATKALIARHAGLIYSGPIAGNAY